LGVKGSPSKAILSNTLPAAFWGALGPARLVVWCCCGKPWAFWCWWDARCLLGLACIFLNVGFQSRFALWAWCEVWQAFSCTDNL